MAVKQDEGVPFVDALHRARVGAYPPGEFVEQESFMRAGEIRILADQAGIVAGAVLGVMIIARLGVKKGRKTGIPFGPFGPIII